MTPDRSEKTPAKPVVLFDGECPLCRKEIAHYRRLQGAESIEWVDITQHGELESTFGVAKADAMTRFHVKQPDGQWATGAYGFALVWSHLDGYRWLATLVRRLRLLPLLDWGYTRVTAWRLKRRCTDNSCSTAGSMR